MFLRIFLFCALTAVFPHFGLQAAKEEVLRLSLEQALDWARSSNPQLAIQRAGKARASAKKIITRQGFSPQLKMTATYLHADSDLLESLPALQTGFPPSIIWESDVGPVNGNIFSLELVQPLINVTAWHAREEASKGVEAAELAFLRAQDEVTMMVMEAYFGAVTVQRQVEAEKKGLGTARNALRKAKAGFQEGLIPPVDILSAKTRVAEMESRVARAEAQVTVAHSMLKQVLGLDGKLTLELTDSVPEPSNSRIRPNQAVSYELIDERHDLQALEKAVSAAKYGIRRAQAAYYPDLSLYARIDHLEAKDPLEFNESGWLLGISVNWSIFAGFNQMGQIREAQAIEAERRARLQAVKQRAWAEAEGALARWKSEMISLKSASKAVLDAQEALALTEARYSEGLDDITALLRAQAEELSARTREINARYQVILETERYRLAIDPQNRGESSP